MKTRLSLCIAVVAIAVVLTGTTFYLTPTLAQSAQISAEPPTSSPSSSPDIAPAQVVGPAAGLPVSPPNAAPLLLRSRPGGPTVTLYAEPGQPPVEVLDPGDGRPPTYTLIGAPLGKVTQARAALSQAKAEEERAKARQSLREALAEQFDSDIENRRSSLEQLTNQHEEMDRRLSKRTASRDELIALQLKAIELDAGAGGASPVPGASNSLPGNPNMVIAPPVASELPVLPGGASNPYAPSQNNPFGLLRPAADPQEGAIHRLHEQIRKLQHAKADDNADEVTKAMAELKDALEKYFDEDLETRRQELAGIKSNLERMATGLQKRAAAKNEIVDLQLKMAEYEADGLGFFNGAGPASGSPYGQPGYPQPVPAPRAGGYGRSPGRSPGKLPGAPSTDLAPDPMAVGPAMRAGNRAPGAGYDPFALPSGRNGEAVSIGRLRITIEKSEPALIAVDSETGLIAWKTSLKDLGGPVNPKIGVSGENLLITAPNGAVHKFDGTTGKASELISR
jgi:hypothetical protein